MTYTVIITEQALEELDAAFAWLIQRTEQAGGMALLFRMPRAGHDLGGQPVPLVRSFNALHRYIVMD